MNITTTQLGQKSEQNNSTTRTEISTKPTTQLGQKSQQNNSTTRTEI